jgi:hypothetical protein
VAQLVEVSPRLDAPEQRSDADLLFDVVLGVVSASVGAGLAVARATVGSPVLRSAAGWRAPFVPARLQPATLLAALARRGGQQRVRVGHEADRLLDQWTPVIAELVVSRLDLTGIVIRHVDIDDVVEAVDVVAIVQRVDVVGMVEEVIAAIDLPAIIRDSTGSMASETVRGARMTGFSADEAISRSIERHLLRRRRPPTTTGAQ